MPSQASKTELRAGSLLAGKYKLQRQLGRGASGAVWAAINIATSRQVALKVLLRPEPKARERLLREARAAGALKHPNVVDVYDVILAEDGSPALVLEGQTLEQLIFERAPLPPVEVAAIGRDVARALAVAHASGIVHRDLKPANIFMHRPSEDDEPIVKVVDFGISKNLLSHEQTLTETGMAVGSPSFMSPEQVRGERTLDGRTDLWALGVIMYEMLCGKRLFDGRAHEVLTLVLVQPVKPIGEVVAGINPVFERVVMGLLERDLGKRLASAEDVSTQLATYCTAAREGSQRPTDSPPASKGQPRDTSVVQVPKASAVPRIHEDDDDDEATHVAPMAMRQALAKQSAVPSVYQDDEEDEDDRTRVAPDAVLTAAIQASREPTPDMTASESDQNAIPTVRPPGLARGESDPPGGNTIADAPQLTANGTQKLAVDKVTAQRPAAVVSPAPKAGGAKPLGDKASVVRPAPARPLPGKAPVGPAPALRGTSGSPQSPLHGPLGQRGYVGSAPMKDHVAKGSDKAPANKPAPVVAAIKPSHEGAPPSGPRPEQTPSVGPVSERTPHARSISEKAPPVSDRTSRPTPVGQSVPVVGPPDADVDEEAISERSPSVRPMADEFAPKVVIDKASSERAPSFASDHAPSSSHAPGHGSHAPGHHALSPRPDSPPSDPASAERPSAVETGVHPNRNERSDALITWIVTVLVAGLLILAAYLYTHRGG